MDVRWRNYKGGSEHRWRRNMDRREIARRIEIQRVAALGIQLANARRAGKANAHRSRDRFTWANATSGARSGSRHLYDQSSAADRGRGALNCSGVLRAPKLQNSGLRSPLQYKR